MLGLYERANLAKDSSLPLGALRVASGWTSPRRNSSRREAFIHAAVVAVDAIGRGDAEWWPSRGRKPLVPGGLIQSSHPAEALRTAFVLVVIAAPQCCSGDGSRSSGRESHSLNSLTTRPGRVEFIGAGGTGEVTERLRFGADGNSGAQRRQPGE